MRDLLARQDGSTTRQYRSGVPSRPRITLSLELPPLDEEHKLEEPIRVSAKDAESVDKLIDELDRHMLLDDIASV